jgi:hypothetical protein
MKLFAGNKPGGKIEQTNKAQSDEFKSYYGRILSNNFY